MLVHKDCQTTVIACRRCENDSCPQKYCPNCNEHIYIDELEEKPDNKVSELLQQRVFLLRDIMDAKQKLTELEDKLTILDRELLDEKITENLKKIFPYLKE